MAGSVMVPKKTFSYTDSLVAVGMAQLLWDIATFSKAECSVKVRDEGEEYVVEVEPGITSVEVEQWKPNPGYPYIRVKSENPGPPPGYEIIDYEREREKEALVKEQKKATKGKRNKVGQIRELTGERPDEPRADLPTLKVYNAMRMGSESYNQLFKAIIEHPEEVREAVKDRLGLIEKVDDAKGQDALVKAASNLQLFNPVAGKGVYRPKPDGTSLQSFPDKLVDWFEEWMKFRALHLAMIANNTGPDGKDTKVLVIAPGEVEYGEIERLRKGLLESRLWGSVVMDIRAILELTRYLITHSKEYEQGEGLFSFARRSPSQVIRGLYSTYFKNLGTASAVMNVSFLGIPGWFPISSSQDAEDWLGILKEHERCLGALDERHSDDVETLLAYRNFLSSGELRDGLEFFALYAARFMHKKSSNEWAEAFTTKNLRRMLFMYKVDEIIQNPGFLNIATAVRKATINPQMRKAMTGVAPFEIHYGLAQEWKRKARDSEQLITALSDFVQQYNAENAKHAEQNKERRRNITTDDLNEVLRLIHGHGSELVGMLLLAFGYAREPQEEASEK